MKRVVAIVRSEKLSDLKAALERHGFIGMTVTPVVGAGGARRRQMVWRGIWFEESFTPMMKFEIVAVETDLACLVQVIQLAARTGNVGDGRIFIEPVEEAVRIRDGRRGSEAIGAGRLVTIAPREKEVEVERFEYERA